MPIALFENWGDWVVLGVLILIVIGLVIALYTRAGSEIDDHPRNQQRLR